MNGMNQNNVQFHLMAGPQWLISDIDFSNFLSPSFKLRNPSLIPGWKFVSLVMDNSNPRKQMRVAASFQTSLDVVISLLKHNNLLIRNGQA